MGVLLLAATAAPGLWGCKSSQSSAGEGESAAVAPEPPDARIEAKRVKKDVPARAEFKSELLGDGAVELEAPLKLVLDVRGNEGTKVSIAGVDHPLTHRSAMFEIDLRPHLLATLKGLGKMSKGLFKNGGAYVQFFTIDLPVKLVGTNGEEKTGKLAVYGERVLRWFLETHMKEGKPAELPGEAEAKPGGRRAILMPSMPRWDSSLVYEGPEGGGFDIVDLYAIHETAVRTKSCGTYRGSSSTTEVTLKMHDAVITVYDRHTGKQVATKTVSASSVCPRITDASPTTLVEDEQIKAWLRTLVRS